MFVAVIICEDEAGVRFVAVVSVEGGGEPVFGRGTVEMADSFCEGQGFRVGARGQGDYDETGNDCHIEKAERGQAM